ncbi:MAG: CPBP family intramembrane metalloprotease [Deltaproteobacteria bacterium]|nr:CPBP family intramembrane metalloprotease [Deltaproteobacteria bacterium]
MPEPRERRGLVPVEIALVLAIALIPWPEALPIGIPLLLAASVCRWLRGRSWAEVFTGGADHVAIGAAAGVAALALAIVLGTPVVEAMSMRGVEWSRFPIVRGSAQQMMVVLIVVSIGALAAELAFRGWLLERMLELSPGPAVLPVMCGAIAEAIVMPGDLTLRLGAGLFGAGLGWMYVAGGRSIVAPVIARVAFVSGAVVLEGLKLIG